MPFFSCLFFWTRAHTQTHIHIHAYSMSWMTVCHDRHFTQARSPSSRRIFLYEQNVFFFLFFFLSKALMFTIQAANSRAHAARQPVEWKWDVYDEAYEEKPFYIGEKKANIRSNISARDNELFFAISGIPRMISAYFGIWETRDWRLPPDGAQRLVPALHSLALRQPQIRTYVIDANMHAVEFVIEQSVGKRVRLNARLMERPSNRKRRAHEQV